MEMNSGLNVNIMRTILSYCNNVKLSNIVSLNSDIIAIYGQNNIFFRKYYDVPLFFNKKDIVKYNLLTGIIWKSKYNYTTFNDSHTILIYLSIAVYVGNMEIVKFLFDKHSFLNTNKHYRNQLYKATIYGHVDIVKLISSKVSKENQIIFSLAIIYAAKYGKLNVLKWVYRNMSASHKYFHYFLSVKNAIIANNLNVIKWLHKTQNDDLRTIFLMKSTTVDLATEYGHLNIVKWFIKNKYRYNLLTIDIAAKHDYLHIIQWIYAYERKNQINNFDVALLSHIVLKTIVEHNRLNILEWLFEKNLISGRYEKNNFSLPILDIAAKNGFLKMVKWLHANNFDATTNAVDWAAENGHFAVVKWLVENRKEGFTDYAIEKTIDNEHYVIAEYLESVLDAE